MPDSIIDIYCRVADEDGVAPEDETNNLDQQEAACRAYCQAHNLTVGTIYREVQPGFQFRERPGLMAMRRRWQSGDIQGVVITKLNRLSRSLVHLVYLVGEMEKLHIALYLAEEREDETPMGRLMRTVLNLIQEVAREQTEDNPAADSTDNK